MDTCKPSKDASSAAATIKNNIHHLPLTSMALAGLAGAGAIALLNALHFSHRK